jgi:hypothetical protein
MVRSVAITVVLFALVAAGPADARMQRARDGAVRATYTFGKNFKPGTLRIWNRDRLIVTRRAYVHPTVRGRVLFVRQLDATGPPEVLLHLYSGGAHCCSETWIYTGAKRARKLWGHGGPPVLRDDDRDGKPEFHGWDTSFAYAFASFGGSRFPAKVWCYERGAVRDVSASFPAEIGADMAEHLAAYHFALASGNVEGVRAALAAYAADAQVLGRLPEAMALVQAAIDAGQIGDGVTEADPNWQPDFLGTLKRLLRVT